MYYIQMVINILALGFSGLAFIYSFYMLYLNVKPASTEGFKEWLQEIVWKSNSYKNPLPYLMGVVFSLLIISYICAKISGL